MLDLTPDKVSERSALRINPAKTCQPVGAMYAALGVHRCMPLQSWFPGLLLLPPDVPDPSFQRTSDRSLEFVH